MTRLGFAVVLVALLLVVGLAPGQQEGKKYKGTLPANWKKLGLSDEQVQKVYKAQAEYREKIDALEEQIKKLKADMQKEMEKVLTPAQKATLRDIKAGPAGDKPAETARPKDDKKKDDKKPEPKP